MLYIYYILRACDMSSITVTFANIWMVMKLMDHWNKQPRVKSGPKPG